MRFFGKKGNTSPTAPPPAAPAFDFNIGRGYGISADGGGSATPIVITTKTQFEDNFAGGNRVLDIQANIDRDDIEYEYGSNTTIKSSNGSRIRYGQDRFNGKSNILVENILRQRSYNDLFNFRDCQSVMFKHCKLDGEATVNVTTVSGSADVNSQVFDGLLDFSNVASDDITVMFCQFLNHNKCTIINLDEETEITKVTYAYDYFFNCYQRTTRSVSCHLDMANNYFKQCRNMTDVGFGAEIRSRSNYYENCNRNWVYENDDEGHLITDGNNVYVDTDINPERSKSGFFTLPGSGYNIPLLASTYDVPAFVLAKSGNVLHTL